MDEFGLIHQYFARGMLREDVAIGIGDDCAVLSLEVGHELVVSIDTMVAGVHFPHDADPGRIGTRALCTALSDLAAMGAQPHWFTLALTMPTADAGWLSAFSDGLFDIANRYQCSLVGGDTTCGPLCISIQVHGSVPKGRALTRSGARPDDVIFVTGPLGDGAAALAVINKQLTVRTASYDYLQKRFYSPAPRLQAGQLLRNLASATIDLSDGLCADLGKICEASGVGALVDLARIPLSAHWKEQVASDRALQWAVTGGDDYELCFTVPQERLPLLEEWINAGKLQATPIGKVTHKLGIGWLKDGKPRNFAKKGYNHFD